MKSFHVIPCIQKFNIFEVFPRIQNGVIIMFYYYLFSITFCKGVNYMFINGIYSTHVNIAYKFFIASLFFNIGYHLDPISHDFS